LNSRQSVISIGTIFEANPPTILPKGIPDPEIVSLISDLKEVLSGDVTKRTPHATDVITPKVNKYFAIF
jgi:hypothetical protein